MIYSVVADNNKIQPQYGEYNVPVKDGSVVDITVAIPDKDVTVTFSYNEGGRGCISDVAVNNVAVEDFNGSSLTMKAGQTLSFNKARNWQISSMTVNGQDAYIYSYYETTIMDDTKIAFIANYEDNSVTINVDIDDASHVTARNTSTDETIDLVTGNNAIKADRWQTIEFAGVAPWAIKEVINTDTNQPEYLSSGKWSKYINGAGNYTLTTYDIEASRTATATVNVDNASKVLFRRSADYSIIALADGVNTIKFNPETETEFVVMPSGSAPLWEVTFNGEPMTASYGTYYLNFTDGCTVDITANIPDKDVTVTFEYNEGGEGCVGDVKVDGTGVENFDGKILNMKAGQQLSITQHSDFKIDAFAVNGESTYFYNPYTATVMDNMTISFTAHELAKIKATVIVDDPAHVIVAKGGYSIENGATPLELTAGENEIEVSEANPIICWKAVNGCYISEVKIGENVQSEYTNYATIKEGDVVTFTTGEIVMDQSAIFWIDNKAAAASYFNLQGTDNNRTAIDVATGYNRIAFYEGMLPLGLSWYGEEATVGKVYINGLQVSPQYQGSTTYELFIEDGDVVKLFLATEPVDCTVTFDIEEGIELSAITDGITEVADLSKPLTVFAGTSLDLTKLSEEEIDLKVNGQEVTPGEEGYATIFVTGPTTVEASVKEQNAISEIGVDGSEADAIYDLQGRRLNKAGKGIYIINGKQTLRK